MDSPLYPRIASRIQTLRKQRKLDQKDLAALVGCTTRQVQRWEAGEQIPGRSFLRALAKALGVEPQDIVSPRPRAQKEIDIEEEIFELWSRLDSLQAKVDALAKRFDS